MAKRQLTSTIKPEYYLEVDGEDEMVHIDDKSIDTLTRAASFAVAAANKLGKRVKLRAMNTLGTFEPELIEVDASTGEACL